MEPSAIGVAKRRSRAAEYIGWRTMRYGPVEITVWPAPISTVLAAKVLARRTRKMATKESATAASAASDAQAGIEDQPWRRSRPPTTNIARKPSIVPAWIH